MLYKNFILYKEMIVILLIGSIFILFCVSFTACVKNSVEYVDREVDDFIVRFYDDYCEIKGTSAQGNENRFLVIPSYIDGIKVKSIGYASIAGAIDTVDGELTFPDIESGSVEKIYLESAIELYPFSFQSCPNLTKIMSPQVLPYDYAIGYDIYYPCNVYKSVTEDGSYFVNRFPANISYYYNYERADGVEYYWIDDCEYGSNIEFIPPEPTREGYTFGGWYKEAECINVWDFDTDTLPEKLTEMQENSLGETEEVTVYQETVLYAKWV